MEARIADQPHGTAPGAVARPGMCAATPPNHPSMQGADCAGCAAVATISVRSSIDHGREDPPAQLVAATAAALGLRIASLMIKETWDFSCTFHTVSQMIVQTVMIPLPPSLVLLRAVISPCLHELSALLHVLCAVPCCVLCRCLSV